MVLLVILSEMNPLSETRESRRARSLQRLRADIEEPNNSQGQSDITVHRLVDTDRVGTTYSDNGNRRNQYDANIEDKWL